MVLSLDISQIDNFKIIGICIEHKLYTPLIYISSRAEDFISPLVKMFSEYRKTV